jgi:biotin-[acetyl-CoA-carboxylase] ligase BirA-like protein
LLILTDNIEFSDKYFNSRLFLEKFDFRNHIEISELVREIFPGHDKIFYTKIDFGDTSNRNLWNYLLIVKYANKSQYDSLIELAHKINLPDGIICLAGSGKKFHGFHNREWKSVLGNLHLSIYLSPRSNIKKFGVGFLIMSAVSVVMAIDDIPGFRGKASIKWVNDILIDQAKIAGVIAYTMAQGDKVTDAILGIAINVESTPKVESTDFVPTTACLNDFLNIKINERFVFERLLIHLSNNYKVLLKGGYKELIEFYRLRSCVVGKKAIIMTDEPDGSSVEFHKGIVTAIGDDLELYFNNLDKAVTKGRMILQ